MTFKILKIFFIIILFFVAEARAQNTDTLLSVSDTVSFQSDSSYIIGRDTLPIDSNVVVNDSLQSKKVDEMLDIPVSFSAMDSLVIDMKHHIIIMYGDGDLQTDEMKLKSPYIDIDLKKSELSAWEICDSTGKVIGRPIFSDNDQTYTAKKMRYNFKNKTGVIYDVITEEEQGFLHGEVVKIHPNKEIHIKNGKFTTCNKPHPHFYVQLTKAKVLPKHRIVTKGFYLVIADIPLPLGLPFGFFPNTKRSTSGFIIPTTADSKIMGYGLQQGGYYWAVNDYMDMKFLGDFYTSGSWTGNYSLRYVKRYAFSSNFNFSYTHIRNGEKILRNFQVNNTFSISATYSQDQKARPNSNFSANINFIKGQHRQYNARDINDFTNNTTASSISYQKNFAGTPFNLTFSANSTQNLSDSTVNLTFPTLNLSMNRIYPLKSLVKIHKNSWYEKIGLTMNAQFKNNVFTHDSVLFYHPDSLLKIMKNGVSYNIQTNTSVRFLKYFNLTPNFSYNGRIYFHSVKKNMYIEEIRQEDSIVYDTSFALDTTWGFTHNFNFRFNVGINTALYGIFNLNIGKVKAVRHVMRPSVSFSYQPDFSDEIWGFYYTDPEDSTRRLSYTADGIFGSPSVGEQRSVNFSVSNNFEMKVRKNDTVKNPKQAYKKVKLIDNLSFSSSYNFAADSLRWSPVRISMSMSPLSGTSVSMSGQLTPYAYNPETGYPINRWQFYTDKKPFRLKNFNMSFSTRFSSNDFKNKKNRTNQNSKTEKTNKPMSVWSSSLNYRFSFNEQFNREGMYMDYNISQYLGATLNMDLTQNFSLGVSSGYDFNAGKLTSTTFRFHRDLHCWEINLEVTPFGRMKGYKFIIQPKAGIFEGLHYKREKTWLDNLQ